MSPASTNKISLLRDRSLMLGKARDFFKTRGVVEVDCPMISASASVDAHIDLIPIIDSQGEIRYLHSSPEYGMKRLLADGMGDIYQLSHVFRQGEYGHKHNPEFMMAEWYRVGKPFSFIIEETLDFIRLFVGNLPAALISYREIFLKYVGIDYLTVGVEPLLALLEEKQITPHETDKEGLLNLILGTLIEPQLGQGELTVLSHYPASQAALAQTLWKGEEQVAERFEIYYRGIELCNGYHELADSREQRKRLHESNEARIKMGKTSLPIDENFLKALEKGLPDSCGVAVGFDRLMMLRHQVNEIHQVIPFDWQSA